MKISINSKAPNFTTESTSNKLFELDKDAAGQPCIFYFYPKDFTPICTIEACEFRSTFEFFSALDVKVFGISKDNIETHHKFKEAYELPYDLLADPEGKVATLYDAYMPLIKFTKRVTYLLNADHNIVHISNNIFEDRAGIEQMIDQLKAKAKHNINKKVTI
jgi:peroxiredoxin Q/BCP